MSETRRLLVGNLGCEAEFGGRPLKLAVERTISLFATALRAFAADGDELWTPALVPEERVADVPGLARPKLLSGSLSRLRPSRVLAWCSSASVTGLCKPCGQREPALNRAVAPSSLRAASLLWEIPAAAPLAAARANHRSFALESAEALGVKLEGAALLRSVSELERHLALTATGSSPSGAWVLKAPYSTSGRDRVRSQGALVSEAVRGSVERLFKASGEVLFEPWLDRTADFGVCAVVAPGFLHVFPPHELEVDSRGSFRGIRLRSTTLSPAERSLLDSTANGVAGRLRIMGYSGPFGIDAWRHRDRDGRERFHPLGEINARMTFGLVARALEERLVDVGRIPGSSSLRLRFGKGAELERQTQVSPELIPLVSPLGPASEAVWVEICSQRPTG